MPLDNQTSSIVENTTKVECLLTPNLDDFIIMDETPKWLLYPQKYKARTTGRAISLTGKGKGLLTL